MYLKNILHKIGKVFSQYKLTIINGIITKEKYFKISIDLDKYSMELSISDFSEKHLGEGNYSDIDISGKIVYKNYTIKYGEGSYGGDGFIIIIGKDNKIKWLMFHEEINPIENMEIRDNKIIGINNCGIKYEFEIDWKNL